MKNLYRSITLAVLLITVFIITVVILQHVNKLEARKLEGKELLSNLRGYIKVGRIEEAASVLESLSGSIFIDQARFEVAKAYVQENRGEEAIKLLDQISLHDRSFDFQRAVLREKIRGLFSFFFDPAGNLRTPAQLKDFIFHSYYNPDPELIQKNPKNFTDPNQLLDYFNLVIKQMEDILKIEGLKRSAEPALAECYDAIQILLYGRGVIERSELEANLRLSPTGDSERTLYLLGNQYITEADFESSFKTWQKLAEKYPDSDSMKKAFSKTYELFRCRELLKDSFAFWPMDKPDWFNSMETSGKFKAETAEIDKKLDAHQDLAL